MDDKLLDRGKQFSEKRKKRKTWKSIVSVLGCIVVFCTTYALILPAITMENKAYCGIEEHSHNAECYETHLVCTLLEETEDSHEHTDDCYIEEKQLICGLEECEGHTHSDNCKNVEKTLTCEIEENEEHVHTDACYTESITYVCGLEESEGHMHSDECYEASRVLNCGEKEETEKHIHTEACYQKIFVCTKEEHAHEKICYSNKNADVETAEDWEATIPEELSTVWADDVIAVAESQLGYAESTKNYIVTDSGEVKGYSRYGDWYGDSYGHWCAMFVSFCLEYAEVDEELMPQDANCQNWIETLSKEEYNLYHEAKDYDPVPGDLIFFNFDSDEPSDHIGIVVEVTEATESQKAQIKTIEGNSIYNNVSYITYDLDDECIMGYGELPKNPDEKAVEEETVSLFGLFLANRSVDSVTEENELTGIWDKDILTVVESEIGTTSTEYTTWYGENYGGETNDNASAAFVSYCIIQAGISEDDIPISGNISEYIEELESAEMFRENAGYIPKAGDFVFIASGWGTTDRIAVISEVSYDSSNPWGSYIKYIMADPYGNVAETSYNGFTEQKGYIKGFAEIPRGELEYSVEGVLTATASYAVGNVENGAKLVVEILSGSEWEEAIKTDVETYGYELTNTHYLSIRFEKENSDGTVKQVEPTGPVSISIDFDVPLEMDSSDGSAKWIQRLVNDDGTVVSPTESFEISVNDSNAITNLTLTYENAQAIVVSAIQETYTTLEVDTELGTAKATYRTLDISENTEVSMVVKFLKDEECSEAWSEALEAQYIKEGYGIPNIQYFTIGFEDADGNTVAVDGAEIEVEITFEPVLEAVLENGVPSEDGEWYLDIVEANDSEVSLTSVEASPELDEECGLEKVSFTYEEAARYSLTAVVLDSTYVIEKTVYSYEELCTAINEAGSSNTVITIGEDFTADGPIEISGNKRIVIDLNGNTIQTTDTLFVVKDSTLSVKDSVLSEENTSDIGSQTAGKTAIYNSTRKLLTYYVTESKVVDINTGATEETVIEHTVTLAGTIEGGTAPIVVVESGTFNFESGALVDSANRAIVQKGGTVNLTGGYICGNSASSMSCTDGVTCWDGRTSGGAVYVAGSSTLNLSGTVLAANSAPERGGAIAVESSNNAVVNMTGGIISGNSCTSTEASPKESGDSSHMGGAGISIVGNVRLNLTGGYITNNKTNPTGYYDGGGGVFAKNGCYLVIDGVYITGNYSNSSAGGVYTAADFLMTSGYVNGNYAAEAEGGGIAVNEPATAFVYGGYINNNTTNTSEHWGGGGLFCANGSTLVMENALVTDNYAGGYGGGVAGCSTGRVYLFIKKGAAIYDNSADGKNLSGDISTKNEDHTSVDPAILKYGFEDYFCALNSVVDNYMLGGYPANWKGSVDGVPVEAGEGDTLVSSYVMLLKSHPSSEAISVAQREAKIYINGNSSNTHGGGILANGYLIVGEESELPVYSRIRLKASKALLGDGSTSPVLEADQFEFVIENADTGMIIATAKNDEDGIVEFNQMLPFMEEGTFTYLVYEKQDIGNESGILMDTSVYRITVKVDKISLSEVASYYKRYQYKISSIVVEKQETDGWSTISENYYPEYSEELPLDITLTSEASFTNYQVSKTNISVLKKWVGIEPEEGTTINVQLYRNGEVLGDTVELNEACGWYYSWGELPLFEIDTNGNQIDYTYSVKEIGDTSDYEVEYGIHNTSEKEELWVPLQGNLVAEGKYIIVSGDGEHILNLTTDISGWYILNENDKQNVTPKTDSITLNGKEYSNYYYASELGEQSKYVASYENGSLMLKYYGGGWNLLTVDNGQLKSGYDPKSNLFVGNTQICYNSSSEKEYKIVYDGSKFTVVDKSEEHENEAQIYEYVMGDATTETIFTITNTKLTEEKTYKIDITKVSEKDNNIRLAGAHFALYLADEEGELVLQDEQPIAVTFIKAATGKYEYCDPGADGATTDIVTDTVTDFWGKLILDKLPAGNYILREISAPNGYEPIEDIKISLGEGSDSTMELLLEDERIEEEIYELPETGGSGTNVYTAGGILLLMISALLYIKKKNQMKGGQWFD